MRDSCQISGWCQSSDFFWKFLEKIVANRLLAHTDMNWVRNSNLLIRATTQLNQHCCMCKMTSTELANDNGVMLTLRDHSKFIQLLEEEFCVKGTAKDWFASYLSDRYFRVKVGSFKSDPLQVDCGVP